MIDQSGFRPQCLRHNEALFFFYDADSGSGCRGEVKGDGDFGETRLSDITRQHMVDFVEDKKVS